MPHAANYFGHYGLWIDASGSGFAVFDRLPGRRATTTMNTPWEKKKGWREYK
jgi:hypothetical protein